MNRSCLRLSGTSVLLLVLAVLAGCLGRPQVAPPYPRNLATEPAGMVPYENDGIRMALPAFWKQQPILSGDSDLKAQFKRTGSSAILQVYCQGTSVSRTLLQVKVLSLIDQDTVANERLWPDYSLGDGKVVSEFSAWTGTAKDGSKKNYYIAWKLPSGVGCSYGVYMSVKQEEARQVEGEFIAIARSLN